MCGRNNKYTVSQKTSRVWFAITLTHVNAFWYIFGRNVADKVSNQKTLYRATSNNVCFCTTWQTGKHENRIFSLKCCISALQEFNQSLLDFCSLSDSRVTTYTHAAVWLSKYNNQCVQLEGCWGAWFRRKLSRERRNSWTVCCTHNACAPIHCLPERKNVICVMCLIAFNICWDSKISH